MYNKTSVTHSALAGTTQILDLNLKKLDNVFTHNFSNFKVVPVGTTNVTVNDSPAVDIYMNWKLLYMNGQTCSVRVGLGIVLLSQQTSFT